MRQQATQRRENREPQEGSFDLPEVACAASEKIPPKEANLDDRLPFMFSSFFNGHIVVLSQVAMKHS
jgi:hypothetical protein